MIYNGFISTPNGYYSKYAILKIERYFYRSDRVLVTFTDGTEFLLDGCVLGVIDEIEGVRNGKN